MNTVQRINNLRSQSDEIQSIIRHLPTSAMSQLRKEAICARVSQMELSITELGTDLEAEVGHATHEKDVWVSIRGTSTALLREAMRLLSPAEDNIITRIDALLWVIDGHHNA